MNVLIRSMTASAVGLALLAGTAVDALAQGQGYYPPPQQGQYPPAQPDQGQGYYPPQQQGQYPQGQYPQGQYPQEQYPNPAQQYPPQQQPQQGYPQGYQAPAPYQDPALQAPPGYTAQDAQRDQSEQARAYDRGYAAAAQQWSTTNCIRQEQNRTAAGAIIGGVLGAVIGSNIAGGRDRGAGAVVGGALGAVAGGAVAQSSGPGCPPGYVLRPGAPAFYYGPPPGAAVVVYDQPSWYNPWIWYDGAWVYRPYPYHRYYGERYGRRR